MRWSKRGAAEAVAVLIVASVVGGMWCAVDLQREADQQERRQIEFAMCIRRVPEMPSRPTIRRKAGLPMAILPVERGADRSAILPAALEPIE